MYLNFLSLQLQLHVILLYIKQTYNILYNSNNKISTQKPGDRLTFSSSLLIHTQDIYTDMHEWQRGFLKVQDVLNS